jgi:phage shock protein PspC (stress-responsive transcriptional regulator)
MKEVEKVSIGGYAFTLEKDAAETAAKYLAELEAHYLGQEGGREIMEGIEERMAELLLEKCGSSGVASLADIRAIIDIIGRPEKIEEDDPEPAPAEKPRRKLFRDQDNKQLAGVCAGLATYLDVDVVWFRLGFTVLTLLGLFTMRHHGIWNVSAPILYLVLWIAMPAARTAQERWAMKGDNGTLDDIARNVKSGVKEMGSAADQVVKSDGFKQAGRFFLVLIGLALLLAGTSGLASLSVLGIKGNVLFGPQYLNFLDQLSLHVPVALDLLETPWIVALAALAVILPFVGMLYGGIQLIFGFRSPSWRPGLVIFILWLIDLVVLMVLGFATALSTGLIVV